MLHNQKIQRLILATATCLAVGIGPQRAIAAGITVGSSSLIGALDYSDTYTLTANGGNAGRPDNVFPVGSPGINVENNYSNAARAWQDSLWSLNTDASVIGGGGYPGGTGAGSATGLTQTGGASNGSFLYGVRSDFVVQFDAVQADDRVNIFTGSTGDIFGGLSLFFRAPGGPNPQIGIFNGGTEFNTGLTSGISSAGQWHNYAVRFAPNQVDVYVDEVLRGSINLTTFNGGSFLGYSNAWVGAGSEGYFNGGGDGFDGPLAWTDNFQVGIPVPEPGSLALLAFGLGSLGLFRRRR